MHHVTINQKNQKKGRQKEGNLSPRKLSPKKCLQKDKKQKKSPKCLQKNRKQQIPHVPPKEQEATKFPHVRLSPSIHSRLVGSARPMSPPAKKTVRLWIGSPGAMATTNTNTRSGASAYRFERIAARSQFLAT